MTIGPEPMSRIFLMSSRLGTRWPPGEWPPGRFTNAIGASRLDDFGYESVKQVQRVARTGPRLRVVLHRGSLHVAQDQALDRAVIEVDVGQLGGAEVRLPAHRLVAVDRPRAVGAEHGKPVVLAGDLRAPGR